MVNIFGSRNRNPRFFFVCEILRRKKPEKIAPKQELSTLRQKFGIRQSVLCSQEENEKYAALLKEKKPLPSGVRKYQSDDSDEAEFYTVYAPELSKDELEELLTYKKLNYLRTIKNCIVFFTVLTVISIIILLVSQISLIEQLLK